MQLYLSYFSMSISQYNSNFTPGVISHQGIYGKALSLEHGSHLYHLALYTDGTA